MSVTPDYKVIRLSRELEAAVRMAMNARIVECREILCAMPEGASAYWQTEIDEAMQVVRILDASVWVSE